MSSQQADRVPGSTAPAAILTGESQSQEREAEGWPSALVARVWVLVLVLTYTCSMLDRQILALMVDLIKADLLITDSQFGLLYGLSFAILYSTAGLFIGGLVDRFRRGRLIAVGAALWSLMTALCGLASRFSHLFAARVGVGVGEATVTPAAFSLLSDCFPPNRLGRALAIYMTGLALGSGLALILGGALIDVADEIAAAVPLFGGLATWQVVFLVVALPGFPLAVLLWMLPEPARRGQVDARVTGWREFFAFLTRHRALLLPLMTGLSSLSVVAYAMTSWAPAILIRVHGMAPDTTGVQLGAITMVGMTAGFLGGAWLAEVLDRKGVRNPAILMGYVCNILAVPCSIALWLAPTALTALAALLLMLICVYLPFSVGVAALQALTPNEMRGRVSALYLFLQSAVSSVLGALLPGAITDTVFAGDGLQTGASTGLVCGLFGIVGAMLFHAAVRQNSAAGAPDR